MRAENYPTPAQVSVFLGDVWIDDAYRIEVRDQNPLIPLYGYSQSEFTAVAQGKRIVQGSLIINYRYPEYLRAAIDGTGKKKVEMDRTTALAVALRDAPVDERVNILNLARQQGVGKEMGEIFTEKYVPQFEFTQPGMTAAEQRAIYEDAVEQNENLGVLPSTMKLDPREGITFKIWFDTPNESKYYTVIEGVRLVGRAMTIRNSADGGGDTSSSGQNLFELYTFFAKRMYSRRLQKWADIPAAPVPVINAGVEAVAAGADPNPGPKPTAAIDRAIAAASVIPNTKPDPVNKWYVWKTESYGSRQVVYVVFGKHEGAGSLPNTVRFVGEKEYIISWNPTLFIGKQSGLSPSDVILNTTDRFALTEPGILGSYGGPVPLASPVQDVPEADLLDASVGEWTDIPTLLGL